jgi:hypothetical protein
MDQARCRAIPPNQRPAGINGHRLLEPPFHEGSSLLHPRLRPLRNPDIQLVASMLTDHAAKNLDLVLCAGHDWIETEETRQLGLISRAPIRRFGEQQTCGPEGWQGRGEPSRWGTASKGAGGTWRHLPWGPVSRRRWPTVPLYRHR